MKRYDVARFAASHDRLTDGDRVEVFAVGELIDGVVVVRAATLRGPTEPSMILEKEEPCAD